VSTVQNLTLTLALVDREQALSVHLGPDLRPTRAASLCVTNHQTDPIDEDQESATHTLLRHATGAAGAGRRTREQPLTGVLPVRGCPLGGGYEI
jgi:hypothetical protein